MTNEQFQQECKRTDVPYYNDVLINMIESDSVTVSLDLDVSEPMLQFLHGAMGISTESGELMDVVKKAIIYGKPVDVVNVKEELGDLLWYVSLICTAFGLTISDVMQVNVNKLRARYPEKFTQELALKRDLGAERSVLEDGRGHGDAQEIMDAVGRGTGTIRHADDERNEP